MVTLEALNALYGDCLLLRYPGSDGQEKFWIIDGGPRAASDSSGQTISVWREVLLPRIEDIKDEINIDLNKPLPVALGMVSHIDDDHIFGIMNLMQKLVAATAMDPKEVKFDRFWFNSFEGIIGPVPAGAPAGAHPAALASTLSAQNLPGVDDEHSQAIMESVPQGITLASSLTSLGLKNNLPVRGLVVAKEGQSAFDIDGAKVTVIGPMQKRLDKLREEWAKALQKPTKEAQHAALQQLFLPQSAMDKAVPNLSSIVVLVEVGGKKLLLTGDANGDDIVTAWAELGLGATPVQLDVLKMPHHGSIRNCSEKFLQAFVAKHYVFSANGKFDNPDPPTLEALVKMHGNRKITMHFTNEDVTWSKPYKLEKDGTKVKNLAEMLKALRTAFPGPWDANLRKKEDKSVVVKLA